MWIGLIVVGMGVYGVPIYGDGTDFHVLLCAIDDVYAYLAMPVCI